MEQNISSKFRRCSATQEILSVSWGSKVYQSSQQPNTYPYTIGEVGLEYLQQVQGFLKLDELCFAQNRLEFKQADLRCTINSFNYFNVINSGLSKF